MAPHHPRPHVRPSAGAGSFAGGGILVLISILARLGGCWGTHLHPLSPLPGVLPGDQKADGQAGPPGPSPPAMVRPRVLRPRPAAPCPSLLPPSPRTRKWGGGQPGIASMNSLVPHAPLHLGGHDHTLALGWVGSGTAPSSAPFPGEHGTTLSDLPPLPLPKDNLQQQIPHRQAAPQQGKGAWLGSRWGCGMEAVGSGMWGVGWKVWEVRWRA